MADLSSLNLLKEVENLGILNIDVTGDQLSLEVIQSAIEATKELNLILRSNWGKNHLLEPALKTEE